VLTLCFALAGGPVRYLHGYVSADGVWEQPKIPLLTNFNDQALVGSSAMVLFLGQ